MNNPFEYPAPPNYPVKMLAPCSVADKLEIVRKADAQKLREIIRWPGSGITVGKAAAARLRKLERQK